MVKNGGVQVPWILGVGSLWSSLAWNMRTITTTTAAVVVLLLLVPAATTTASTSSNNNNNNKQGVHTIVLVPMPQPGVVLKRALTLFGYDDAPSGRDEVVLNNVHLTEANIIAGQARLGAGRIHHCMHVIGMGKFLFCFVLFCFLTVNTWLNMEVVKARSQISLIKYAVPEMMYRVVDRTVQLFCGAGVSDQAFCLARFLVGLRSLRLADGPGVNLSARRIGFAASVQFY